MLEDVFAAPMPSTPFSIPGPLTSTFSSFRCSITLSEQASNTPNSHAESIQLFETLPLQVDTVESPLHTHSVAPDPSKGEGVTWRTPLPFPITHVAHLLSPSHTEGQYENIDDQLTPGNLRQLHSTPSTTAAPTKLIGLGTPFGPLSELSLLNCLSAAVRPIMF